jgi:hypothetical protein
VKTTLAQARTGIDISAALGIPTCDVRWLDLLNRAQSYLADKGRWWGTYRRLYVCVTGGCITWPSGVANVEAFKQCDVGVTILNQWYEFSDAVRAPALDCVCEPNVLLDRPGSPMFLDMEAPGKIRLYPSVASDAGKRVLLQGVDDATGLTIRTLDGATYVDGEFVTVTAPFVTSTFTFRHPGLSGVQKPITNGNLSVFSVHPTSGAETKIAEWRPPERNPDYRRSFLTNWPRSGAGADHGCTTPTTCTGGVVAEAIVRLEFIPASVDTDWLLITNLEALKHGMKGIQKRDQEEYQKSREEIAEAITILRDELEKYSPKRTMRVNVNPHGSAKPARVFAGFV